jgi:hypothetical protein
VPEAEIGRMVDLGVLVPREGSAPFLTGDLHKVRLAMACERAGLPMDGIAAAIRAGRLSFAFLEASSYTRWAVPSGRTYRQVSEETGIPLEVLQETLESMGFAWASLIERALIGVYRRQQELVWTEHQVENIEAVLEEAGPSPGRSGSRRCASWI